MCTYYRQGHRTCDTNANDIGNRQVTNLGNRWAMLKHCTLWVTSGHTSSQNLINKWPKIWYTRNMAIVNKQHEQVVVSESRCLLPEDQFYQQSMDWSARTYPKSWFSVVPGAEEALKIFSGTEHSVLVYWASITFSNTFIGLTYNLFFSLFLGCGAGSGWFISPF